ncbi:MAG: hypothetical protein J6M19_04905 [Bacteroidaceae bacterium]|nr:hypothetical protein [Bacteroidaceae bacterium]
MKQTEIFQREMKRNPQSVAHKAAGRLSLRAALLLLLMTVGSVVNEAWAQSQKNITYKFLNKKGQVAVSQYASDNNQKIRWARWQDVCRSPLGDGFHYYYNCTANGDGTYDMSSLANEIAETDNLNTGTYNIYVTCDGLKDSQSFINKGWVHIAVNATDTYMGLNSSGEVYKTNATATDGYWLLLSENDDPYDVRLVNAAYPDKYIKLDKANNKLITTDDASEEARFALKAFAHNNQSTDYTVQFVVVGTETQANATDHTFWYTIASNNSTITCFNENRNLSDPSGGAKATLTTSSFTYTYHIVNNAGSIATHASVTTSSATPSVPEAIRTPLVSTYRYYSDAACTQPITYLPAANANIYVRYDYDAGGSWLDLSGNTTYEIKENDAAQFLYYNSQWQAAEWQSTEDNLARWRLEGNDPYDIRILSEYYWLQNSVKRYVMARGDQNGTLDTRVWEWTTVIGTTSKFKRYFLNTNNEIVAADDVIYTKSDTDYFYYLWKNSSSGRFKDGSQKGSTSYALTFIPVSNQSLTYTVLNKQGRKAMSKTITQSNTTSLTLSLPDDIRSPLIKNVRYYTTATDNGDGTFTPTGDAVTELSAGWTTQTLYVTYDYRDDTDVNLDPAVRYYMTVGGQYATSDVATGAQGVTTKTETDAFQWQLDAGTGTLDPYDIRLRLSTQSGKYLGGSTYANDTNPLAFQTDGSGTTVETFALLVGNGSNNYVLAVTGSGHTDRPYAYVSCNGASTALQLTHANSYTALSAATQVTLEMVTNQYTYRVYDNTTGALAIEKTVSQAPGAAPIVPKEIRAAFTDSFEFYESDGTTPMTTLPLTNAVVVAKNYTVSTTPALDLTGVQQYHIQMNGGKYAYDNSGALGLNASTLQTAVYRWALTGGDPYHLSVMNQNTGTLLSQPFILTEGAADGQYELLQATGNSTMTYFGTADGSTASISAGTWEHEDNAIQLLFEAPDVNYTFVIVDLSNHRTLQSPSHTGKGGQTLVLDEFMQSPLVETYTYYSAHDDTQTTAAAGLSGDLEGKLPYTDCTIYVGYTPYAVADAPLKLDGSVPYALHLNKNLQRILGKTSNTELYLYANELPEYQPVWYEYLLEGTNINGQFDPYDVKIKNVYENRYMLTRQQTNNTQDLRFNNHQNWADAINSFMLVNGQTGYYEVLGRRTDDISRLQYCYYDNGDKPRSGNGANYYHGADIVQMHIQPAYTYQVKNLNGKLTVKAIESRVITAATAPLIPDIIKSPAVTAFSYYDTDAFNVKDGVYTLKSSATPLSDLRDAKTHEIIVVYSSTNVSSTIDLSGQVAYSMQADPDKEPALAKVTSNNNTTSTQNTTAETLATDPYMWYFTGNDPYNIRIYNANRGAGYITATDGESSWMRWCVFNGNGENESFALLTGTGKSGYDYKLMSTHTSTIATHARHYQYLGRATNQTNSFVLVGQGTGYYPTLDAIQLKFTRQRAAQYTYTVVNTSGTPLVSYTVEGTVGVTPLIPDRIKSPYAKDFTYYDAATAGNVVNTTPSNGTIYVRYAYDPEAGLDMVLGTNYNLKVNGNYAYATGATTVTSESSESNRTLGSHIWIIEGDPYQAKFKNKTQGTYLTYNNENVLSLSATASPFVILSGVNSSSLELMAARGEDAATPLYSNLGRADGSTDLALYNQGTYVHCTPQIAVSLIKMGTPITYHILDNLGREAIKYTILYDGDFPALNYANLPTAIRSPYLEDETLTFYTTVTPGEAAADGRTTYMPSNAVTEIPTVGVSDIYVRYTTDNLLSKALKLRGVRSFNIQPNKPAEGYAYLYDNNTSLLTDATDANKTNRNQVWYISGGDPYAVQIQNVETERYLTYTTPSTVGLGATGSYFILMAGSDDKNDLQITLMAASGDDAAATFYNVGRDGTMQLFDQNTNRADSKIQLLLTEAHLNITYQLIDKQDKIVLSIPGSSMTLGLPDEWKSPLVSKYHYWLENNLTITGTGADATYTNPTGDEIEGVSESVDGNIYVTYDVITDADDANYVDLNPDVTDYKERVRRVANDTSTPMVRNAANFGTMYMLEFLNGVPDYLENGGDEVETFTTKPVYPYNNGDGQMYIYGSDRWNTQSTAGASTRTRWPWYLLAVNNDPYHVMVTSWQNTHARAENGTTTNYYGFLRTYYNTTINQVITTTVSDDPKETTDATHGDPSAVPTEYMLLGQKDAYKLMTTEEVNGSHQTVNSFEQYWKTYETVTKKNEYTLPDMNPGLNHAVTAGTLHSYGAWVNARPDIGGGNRAFEYRDHWYQTISMGDGTFKLNPTEIDAVLVLTDKHGWEVMRHPIAKYSETAKYETVKEFLRKYDSPMVSQYHFYATRNVTHKVAGYHKYNIDYNSTISDGTVLRKNDHVGTGTSLADYPQKFSGGALYDLYVSYDVKPEYADAYTGAATEAATSVNYPFLIRQDGHLAKTTDGSTLTFEDATTTIDVNNVSSLGENDHPELYWYLKPNFDIDTEMGYEYDVEDENHQVISKEATNAAYHTDGKSGFDPYNIQIYNKQYTSAYFTTDASAAGTENHQYMVTTTPAGNGRLSLGGTPSEKFTTLIPDYDSRTLHITNATFMAVQDQNGNMRLMPRFDHSHVVSDFGTLVAPADAQPVEDKVHTQTTWLLRPDVYTYIIVDNEGREALRYSAFNTGSPVVPTKFCSPFATDFKYYKNLTQIEGVYPISGIDANEITGSFYESLQDGGINGNIVYVRYSYNSTADTDGLLKGTWYHAQLNNSDVKITADGILNETFTADAAHHWRFMQNAVTGIDPYGTKLWNGTPATENSGNRYILMGHTSGTGYALMQAGNSSTTQYYFLDGSSTPTITEQANYVTDGTIANTMRLTLTPILANSSVIFKMITNTGHVALTSDAIGVTLSTNLGDVMPEWMRSPLMTTDAYIFYPSATDNGDGTYTPGGVATTSPMTLDDGTVYVRYDYEKSKTSFTSFGFFEQYATAAPLDLSGQVPYVLTLGGGHNFRRIKDDGSIELISNGDNLFYVQQRLNNNVSWLLSGNDPYEVTFVNPAYSETKVLSAKAPSATLVDNADETADMYQMLYMKDPEDAEYSYKTFMILKGKRTGLRTDIGLKLYVTGHNDLFISENSDVRLWKDSKPYKERWNTYAEAGKRNQYSRFMFRPNIVYHVITNEGKEAAAAYSCRGSDYDSKDALVIPGYVQSPLLNVSDFVYYSEQPVWDGTKLTVEEESALDASKLSMVDVINKGISDIYVRYTYDRETSPMKYLDGIGVEDSHGLDLSGGTWYNIARVSRHTGDTWNWIPYYEQLIYTSDTRIGQSSAFASETSYGNGTPSLSDKRMLWRFLGDDPYAIRICNGNMGDKHLAGSAGSTKINFITDSQSADYETFMLLRAKAQDDRGYLDSHAGLVFFTTGDFQKYFNISSTNGDNISTHNTNSPLTPQYRNDALGTYILRSISGGINTGWVSFYKAPVSRKYHYHAYNQAKGEFTWDAVLEHDFLAPLVLEDEIARLYCKYEANTPGSTLSVVGSNDFQTRAALEALNNAQFYSDEAMTKRVHDSKNDTYDIYPEIEETEIYDIYFKYQPDTEATVSGRKLSDITSTSAQVAADVAYRKKNGQLDKNHLKNETHANWFYMVLDTDEDITATGTAGTNSRTFTGKQYFLRREDDGKVGWMNNGYALHKNPEDNYHKWSYNRLAESYRKGDNDAFREGRWLWTFVGDDPYNLRLLNMETAVGVTPHAEGVYELEPADNCWATLNEATTTTTKNGVTTTTTTYPVRIPTAEPTANDTWGICAGYGSEETFSLLSTAMTHQVDGKDVNQLLYWQMATDSVTGATRASDRSNAIQLLPYEPVTYEDVQLFIRRKDEVETFQTWANANPSATHDDVQAQLDKMTTGISKLYFASHDRKYVAGDKIDLTDSENTLPFIVRRAFCDYALYKSEKPFDVEGGSYTVTAGPYPAYAHPYRNTSNTDYLYDEDGHILYKYYNVDINGNAITTTPGGTDTIFVDHAQSIYAHYVVKSDIFLAEHPNETEVARMANENDHVFFMDFPDPSGTGTSAWHHAYYDPMSTYREQTGDLKQKIDRTTGNYRTEKKKWNGTEFVDDQENIYNHYQYRTAGNRMESVPENLKWYFVGDPYKVQVYCTAGDWGSNNATGSTWAADNNKTEATVHANLARFDLTETNFQFVVDCVHLRVPDYSIIDERSTLIPTDEDGRALPDEAHHNRHQGEPFYNDFYWECVPAAADVEGGFALRFKEDNDLMGYRNVYYYLAHNSSLKKQYKDGQYSIDLSYNANNAKYDSGDYKDYHTANNAQTVIKLVQPAKVYVTVNRTATEGRYAAKSNVVEDELSEYFGLGETLTEVPRHLQRKFVTYDWTSKTLTEGTATSIGTCTTTTHSTPASTINDLMPTASQVDKLKTNPVFKYTVNYTVSDLSQENGEHHYFSPNESNLEWVDMTIGNNNWLYYDKTNTTASSLVSNYRRAMSQNRTGWNNEADGWNDGLKGLHWALVGDPYDFVILNRRQKDDNTEGKYLTLTKTTIADYAATVPNDSVIWTTSLTSTTDDLTTSTAIAGASTATHFSTQMWKVAKNGNTYLTGNSDANYFLRTASLKTGTGDNNNASGSCQTNNYWRMVASFYGTNPDYSSYFEMVPYSLSDKDSYTNTVYMSNFSQTMNGLGVTQQKMEIRTAVAKDYDNANNDCFDADVYVYSAAGEQRIHTEDMEIRYGDAIESMPISLKRYGCEYTCYIDYDPVTRSGTQITDFDSDEFRAMVASGGVKLYYVYTLTDEAEQYFTTADEAQTDDYTWMNTYFQWQQTYSGTNVEVEKIRRVFDHYVYNSAGEIIDEVWREESYTETVANPNTAYETKGYLNTHTGQTPVYGDEIAQSEDDRQKWSLVGDPYTFTMKNYAQYLKNANATATVNANGVVQTSNIESRSFTICLDKDGTTYLAIIDADGNILECIDFEYSNTSDKSLYTADATGLNQNDPTGNTLKVTYTGASGKQQTVKPFHLANLIRYADVLVYHLVMAHQHSLDAEDSGNWKEDQKTGYDDDNHSPTGVYSRLLEFLQYWGKKNSKTYTTYTTAAEIEANKNTLATNSEVTALLKEKGTLRNFLHYPIADQEVSRIGIGNRPQLPWYMKRQFCQYTMYQSDVMRSVIDYDHPHTDSQGNTAYNIQWVSIFDISYWNDWQEGVDNEDVKYKVTQTDAEKWGNGLVAGKIKKIPSGYDEASKLQGQVLDKLYPCHENRKVIIDVVYEVNPEKFRFATRGRNTTAWYSMMTNNEVDGLMNFSYLHGIGARQDKTHHYTNNYLWAPEGDPYGFVLRSRYATINGTGWDDVAVTTKGRLPKGLNGIYINGDGNEVSGYNEATELAAASDNVKATYTSRATSSGGIPFNNRRIIHLRSGQETVSGQTATTDGATNAVYEMFVGGFSDSFLMHPTAAWMKNDNPDYETYFMRHNTSENTNTLTKAKAESLLNDKDANWRLQVNTEQLLPYFNRAGFVGGIDPQKAQNYTYRNYYSQLQSSKESGTPLSFSTLAKIQDVVYDGTFKDKDGDLVTEGSSRPASSKLPMTFESANLINMKPGYYRIRAFSEDALNTDGRDMSETGIEGIIGPRYISGYRFESEKTDLGDSNNKDGGRWLHFFETDMKSSTIHTFADLKTKIAAVDAALGVTTGEGTRDWFDHVAMRGNIEILPADFDPSSIFQFKLASGDDNYKHYTFSTQDMDVYARPGGTEGTDASFGKTELANTAPTKDFDNKFRIEDIGGAAMTIRVREYELGDTKDEKTLTGWDDIVAENLKTNYVCIDRNHRYRITCHTNNEMAEIGDHYTTDGYNGIQDTKWLLQPVGIREDWPYNQMPLRVEVQKGGKQARDNTQEDPYYYGTLYVPFDTRLGNTTDAAFTLTSTPTDHSTLTMPSVSQHNGMGNPQYVPAQWPVVLRTNAASSVTLKNQNDTDYATKHYVNMYLPYDARQSVALPQGCQLQGEYLEQTIDPEGKTVLVFGVPFKEEHVAHQHAYDREAESVGWYTNENWMRGYGSISDGKTTNDGSREAAFLATPSTTTEAQRDNAYVYHNKAYLLYTSGGSGAKERFTVIFEGDEWEEELPEDEDIEDTVKKKTPWPCDVYDLSGRKVATHETPQTLRQNNPGLPKGVYIFGHTKVVVK